MKPIQAPSSMRGRGHTAAMPENHIDGQVNKEDTRVGNELPFALQIIGLGGLAMIIPRKNWQNLVVGEKKYIFGA